MNRQLQDNDYARMHDAARSRAHVLRKQAIDDAWRLLGRAVLRTLPSWRRPSRQAPACGAAQAK